MAKHRREYPDHKYSSRRAFLRAKRADGQRLLEAIRAMRLGCGYLPPNAKMNAGTAMRDLEDWITGPCRTAWRKA